MGRGRVAKRPGEGDAKPLSPAPNATTLARTLRSSQTNAERLLWGKLRSRQLGGFKFRRQMPIGPYIVDFCCPDAWLIVELDGGGHSEDAAMLKDKVRTADLEQQGYIVLRFWNNEVFENLDGVCETILSMARGQG